jgi:hypothetical protein
MKILTFANILNQQNGALLSQVALNKKEFNFLDYTIHDKLYYVSTNLSPDSIPGSVITAYNFNGDTILEKQFDSVNFELGANGFTNSPPNNNQFCNIPYAFVTTLNPTDTLKQFYVFDTACDIIMTGYLDSLVDNYFHRSNLHIIDSNTYCLINTIYNDTLSGCYPNTNNIIFRKFSRITAPTSLIKNKNTEANLSVFPNPNNGNFTIDFAAKGNFLITLSFFDITGRIIYQKLYQHNNQSFIQVSDGVLPPGIYDIQISSGGDTWNKKMIIAK